MGKKKKGRVIHLFLKKVTGAREGFITKSPRSRGRSIRFTSLQSFSPISGETRGGWKPLGSQKESEFKEYLAGDALPRKKKSRTVGRMVNGESLCKRTSGGKTLTFIPE